MPRTAAQAEASRRNGARSRGPRTAEGRRRSSQNARTHGLRAASFQVTPDEAERFARLEAEIRQHFEPRDAGQHDACRRIAAALWRGQLLDRLEARIWPRVLAGDCRPLATLLRYRPGVERALSRALAEFKAIRATMSPASRRADPETGTNCTNEPEPAGQDRPNEPGDRRHFCANEPGRFRRDRPNEPGPVPAPPRPARGRPARTNDPGRPRLNRRQRRRLAALGRQDRGA